MNFYARKILIGFCFLLSACATAYQSPDSNGAGYSDQKVADDTYLVSFVGNVSTSPEKIRNYALLYSAQVTISQGYRYFMVTGEKAGAYFQRPAPCEYTRVTPPNVMSGQAYITYDPAYNKFNAVVLEVHLLRRMQEGSADSTYDAYKVIHMMDVKYSLAISVNDKIATSKRESVYRQQCK